jgi:hypothetical protein
MPPLRAEDVDRRSAQPLAGQHQGQAPAGTGKDTRRRAAVLSSRHRVWPESSVRGRKSRYESSCRPSFRFQWCAQSPRSTTRLSHTGDCPFLIRDFAYLRRRRGDRRVVPASRGLAVPQGRLDLGARTCFAVRTVSCGITSSCAGAAGENSSGGPTERQGHRSKRARRPILTFSRTSGGRSPR